MIRRLATTLTASLEKSRGDFCLKLIKKFYEFFAYGLTAGRRKIGRLED
jgi:hypothetical protein